MRVFNPNASCVRSVPLSSQYTKHERIKGREYEQRVREIEGCSCVRLMFSTAGLKGRAGTATFKPLVKLLFDRHEVAYAGMMNFVRCGVSFALLRSALMELGGHRRPHKSCDLQLFYLSLADCALSLS